MNQHTPPQSLRLPLFILLVTLISAIGFFTVHVYAQEGDTQETTRGEGKTSAEERGNIFEEQKEERREAFEQAREDVAQAQTGEDRNVARDEAREEMEELRDEQKGEREAFRSEEQGDTQEKLRAHAQTMRSELATRNEERKQRMGEYKAKLGLATQAHVGQYVERVSVRMGVAIDRLEQIANRINERIVILEEDGRDLADAKTKLGAVYVLLDDARGYVALFGDVSTDALTSETPSEQAQKVRDAAKLAKDSIVEVHRALQETVEGIRATPAEDEEVVSEDDGGDGESAEELTEGADDTVRE